MTQPSASSGDPHADRRFEMARQFFARGDMTAAADLMRQTMELVPQWAEGQFTLADTLMLDGQKDDAIAAFHAYLALDPADSMGAQAKLALLGAASATTPLSAAYVERLFDQYAPRFDKALTEGLKYSAPARIAEALVGKRFRRALDLGCGTGLMGAAIRPLVDEVEGVDLSAGMLAEARRKGIYSHLVHGDLTIPLKPKTYDLILAADVLVYLGDLQPIVTAVHGALVPGGVFAFTVQQGEEDYRLGRDQRFSHSEQYIRSVLSVFSSRSVKQGVFRQEAGIDVPGLLIVASRART